MTATKTIAVSLAVSILIGCIAIFLALPEFATTKGRYTTSAFLFPYAYLVFHLVSSMGLAVPSIGLAIPFLSLAQFPAYGLFYARAWRKNREGWAVAWLLTTHLVLGAAASLLCKIDYSVSRGHYPF